MAMVYYGHDIKLNRRSHQIHRQALQEQPVCQPFRQRSADDGKMAAREHHPNHYADDTQGHSYYAMEYVDGQTSPK